MIAFLEGAAFSIIELLFSIVLIVVVSIYMLLDMDRLARGLDRRFPPAPGSQPLLRRVESAVAGYVKGQVLVSLIIGVSAGVGLWLIGTLGWAEGQDDYALLFGSWVAVAELIPYLGPWLGAIPPIIYALIVDPVSAIWVALLFLAIHQIEGHIVVPKVMGTALRLHPLLVIFGLLAGGADLRAARRLPRAADAGGAARDLGVLRRARPLRAVAGRRHGPGRGRARGAGGAGARGR